MPMIYDYDYYSKLYIEHWNAKLLRLADAFCALGYAFGLTHLQMKRDWPWLNIQPEFPEYMPAPLTVLDQIGYLQNNATRTPKHVIDIGTGRGDIACTLDHMGIDVTAVDPNTAMDRWFEKTSLHWFGTKHIGPKLLNGYLRDFEIDWSTYDTILMVESLEHIPAAEFDRAWENICRSFKGRFIVTNYINMHPIPAVDDEHCRLTDDCLYDIMCAAGTVVFRRGSHLVIDM